VGTLGFASPPSTIVDCAYGDGPRGYQRMFHDHGSPLTLRNTQPASVYSAGSQEEETMRFAIALILVLTAVNAAAEQRCVAQETPRQCLRRLIAARAYETVQAEVGVANTGPGTVSSPIRSAVKDFLSVVSAHLDQSTLNDNGKALVLDYNLPVTILGAIRQVNLETVLTDPELSAQTQQALAGDPAALASLKHSLNHADDVSFSLTFNPVTQRLGRSVDPHRALLQSMVLALVTNGGPAIATIPPASFDTPFNQILPDDAARMTAMADFETAATTAMPAAAALLVTDFTRLVKNQPQFDGSATYRQRKQVVGPRERRYRLTWEIQTDNINSFRRAEGRDCEAKGNCLTAFNDYTSRTAAEHRTGRLALAIEYHSTAKNDPHLTVNPFVEEKATRLTYSVTYGQEITSFVSGKQGRIDFTLDYDGKSTTHQVQTQFPARFVGSAYGEGTLPSQSLPASTTRLAAAATISQPITDRLSVPLSFVWTDRDEWLPGTSTPPLPISPSPGGNGRTQPFRSDQRKLVVHLGVIYRLPAFSRPSPSSTPSACCCR
jgi:hypothetical protein